MYQYHSLPKADDANFALPPRDRIVPSGLEARPPKELSLELLEVVYRKFKKPESEKQKSFRFRFLISEQKYEDTYSYLKSLEQILFEILCKENVWTSEEYQNLHNEYVKNKEVNPCELFYELNDIILCQECEFCISKDKENFNQLVESEMN